MDTAITRSLGEVIERDELVLPEHPDRRVALAGAFNFRDLGGYRGIEGRTVRWRTLFRADALHRLDDDELDVLARFGMRSVLDLRTRSEIDRGRIEADHLGIVHHHLPVLGEAWSPSELDPDADAAEILGSLYVQMLDVGAPALSAALTLLASDANVPAVFHCAAGKDRTGVLAALVLSLMGVADEVIVGDYALTAGAMERLRDRLRSDNPDALTAMNDQPEAYLAAPAGAMELFLSHLHAEHGSAAGYVRDIGVDDEIVADLRAHLMEG